MKIIAGTLCGVLVGALVMFLLYESVIDPHIVEKIIVKKQIVYKTKWRVKKEITMHQAKKCVFSPIVIDTKIEGDNLDITAKDDCKSAKKRLELKTKEGYTGEIVAGSVGVVAGLLVGIAF